MIAKSCQPSAVSRQENPMIHRDMPHPRPRKFGKPLTAEIAEKFDAEIAEKTNSLVI
jgi:hypothetical protein